MGLSLVPSEQVIAITEDIKKHNPNFLKNGDPSLDQCPVTAVRSLIKENKLLKEDLKTALRTIKFVEVTK